MMMENGLSMEYGDGYMEQEEEWEREGLLDPAWEKQQKKVSEIKDKFREIAEERRLSPINSKAFSARILAPNLVSNLNILEKRSSCRCLTVNLRRITIMLRILLLL